MKKNYLGKMKYNLSSTRKSHLSRLGMVSGEKVHKHSPHGMEVAYYQPRLVVVVLKRKGRVIRVSDQLKNKVSNVLTPVKIEGNGSFGLSNKRTNAIST